MGVPRRPNWNVHSKMQQSYSHLKSMLWAEPGARVHAVIRGAVVPGLAQRLQEAEVADWDCLWRGAQTPEQTAVAPYVAELAADSPFTEWLLKEADETYPHWGVLGVGPVSLMAMREHARGLMQVLLPDGSTRRWHWFDPVLWAGLLPQLDGAQLHRAYGPLTDWVVVGSHSWRWLTLSAGQVVESVRQPMAEEVA